MERNPPRTAKEAALQGAQADRPPFDREADKRHTIAAAIRLASLATGQSELADDAADQIPDDSAALDDSESPGMSAGVDGPAQATAAWMAGVDSPASGDLSLAAMIRADQAASHGFPMPPASPNDESSPPLSSSVDAYRPLSWMLDAPTQTAAAGSLPIFLESTPIFDATRLANSATAVQLGSPEAPLPIQDSQFDVSMLISSDASPLPPDFWSGVSDAPDRNGAVHPDSSTQLPLDQAGEPIWPNVEGLSKELADPEPARAEEASGPVSFRPFGESASQPNIGGAPVEKVRIEFESSVAEVKRDSVLMFTGMEPAFISLVEHMGEQDRRDAFALAASRRACL